MDECDEWCDYIYIGMSQLVGGYFYIIVDIINY